MKSQSAKTTTTPAQARPKLAWFNAAREALDVLILVGAIYTLVNLATVRFRVQGASMQPGFQDRQFLIVSRLSYLLGQPERGDIIVFHNPSTLAEDYIKRIIALPGDTVEIRDSLVYVNGAPIDEPYLNEVCDCSDQRRELGPNEYWVMGDNRNHSRDSREFGPILREHIVGEVLIRYWPPAAWGIIR